MYVFIVNEKYCVREEIFILGKFPFKLFFLLFFYLQYNYFIRYYELIYNDVEKCIKRVAIEYSPKFKSYFNYNNFYSF